ncbi:MAG: biotin--[acetyl-CoA-carboxylase] ligase [Chthoniobacterales bacterium]
MAIVDTHWNPWKTEIHFFETIDSTNDFLLELGELGAPEGTIIIAETQTKGRGQFHRPWFSPAGMGLWLSLLLRLPIEQEVVPLLSCFAPVALCDGIESSKIKVHNLCIKEPNDLLIDGKKVAGVLVETRRGASPFAVVGIGLNIYQTEKDFPKGINTPATSLSLASPGCMIDRQQLTMDVINALYRRYQQLHHDPVALEAEWRLRLQR